MELSNFQKAFHNGCNEYIKKPFFLEELDIRIENLIEKSTNKMLQISDTITYDMEYEELQIENEIIKLRQKERKLLTILLQNLNHTVSTAKITAEISKEEYYKTLEKFDTDKPTTNKYINTIRFHKIYKETIGTAKVFYVPLLSKESNQYLFYNNFLMKIEIDISSYMQSVARTKQYFIIFSLILLLLLISLYYITKKNFYQPMARISDIMEKELEIKDKTLLKKKDEFGILVNKYNKLYSSLNKEIDRNKNLLFQNKRFIADTVHQIRTPLTNIMMNSEMIKRTQTDDTMSGFIDQINASINMLTNSYEDLSYITSCNIIEYKPTNLSMTEILLQRVKFFTTISKVNFKEIITEKMNLKEV